MSARDSSLAPASPPANANGTAHGTAHTNGTPDGGPHGSAAQRRKKTSVTRALGLPLALAAAAGVACAWAAARTATPEDRQLVTGAGGFAALLLGVAVALALSRRRVARELRDRTEASRAEAARTAAAYADTVRRAALDLETAQRALRDADVRRRTAIEAQVSLRAALKAETARAAALEGETARLAEVTIPLAVDRLRAGNSARTVLSRLPQPAGAAHQRLLGVLVHELGAGERSRAAGMTACASAAGRIQALTTGILADLREMEDRLGEDVLGDLLHLDHCAAQTGRLADSIAVLTGARSGRRWTRPIVMESVLRGAMGRINAYQRVRLHSASTAAVAGHAAEGVMHALAELMDNACNFSPPTEEVHVYVQETHSGVIVTIEDAGPAMPDTSLVRAEHLVSGEPLDLRAMSGTRLGLAVVGCLARKYGLLVSFRPSSRGGTGVIVLIPPKIVTRAPEGYPVTPNHAVDPPVDHPPAGLYDAEPQVRRPQVPQSREHSPAHARPSSGAGSGSSGSTSGSGSTSASDYASASGSSSAAGSAQPPAPLPKRTRGQTLAAAHHGDLTADPTTRWLEPSPEDEARADRARAAAGARFTAFRDAATGRTRAGSHTGERTGEPAGGRADGRTDGRTGERTGERARAIADFAAAGEGPLTGEPWGADGTATGTGSGFGSGTVPTRGDNGR